MFSLIPEYGYTNARVKAMKGKLLSQEDLRKLLAVDTLGEYVELLEETNYKQDLVDLSTKYTGLELINKALNRNLVSTIVKISKFLPKSGKQKDLLKLVTQEWEVQNLKLLIALKATGVAANFDQFVFMDVKTQEKYAQMLSEQVSFEKMLAQLSHRPDKIGQAFTLINKEVMQKGKTTQGANQAVDFRSMYKFIDEAHYASLFETASGADVPVRKLVEAKLDFVNTMAVLKMLIAGSEKKQITDSIIAPHSHAGRLAMELAKSTSIQTAVKRVVEVHKLPSELIGEFEKNPRSLVSLEVALERKLMEKALRTSKVSVLSFAVVLGYVYLKTQEVTTLKTIAYSTQAGVREEIKKLITI